MDDGAARAEADYGYAHERRLRETCTKNVYEIRVRDAGTGGRNGDVKGKGNGEGQEATSNRFDSAGERPLAEAGPKGGGGGVLGTLSKPTEGQRWPMG